MPHNRLARSIGLFLATLLIVCPLGLAASAQEGRTEEIQVHSKALENNLLGDPADRNVTVYLPPGYDEPPNTRFPVVYLLHGYNVTNRFWTDRETVNDLDLTAIANELINNGRTHKMILVAPDGKNAYGGSWYTDSVVTGNWERFITYELIEYVDANYRTIPLRTSRGIAGHSMGGHGAVKLAMKHPELYNAVYAMAPALTVFSDTLQGMFGGHMTDAATVKQRDEFYDVHWHSRGMIALACAVAPNQEAEPFQADLPVDSEGNHRPLVWKRWLQHDPFTMVGTHRENLLKYKVVALDCGTDDILLEMNRRFEKALKDARIPHTYEEFEGGHLNRLAQRLNDRVLPFFSQNLESVGNKNVQGARPKRQIVETHIPSKNVTSPGVAVQVLMPEKPRYAEGSPVVVQVPGGFRPSGIDIEHALMTEYGFVEIRFAFPGGGRPDFKSGGVFDFRGKRSLRAFADVIRFAHGDLKDNEGRSIRDIAGSGPVLTNNVGVAAWSHGGNVAVVMMAEHGGEFPDLAYLATYESPLGDGALNADCGGALFFARNGQGVNPAYDPNTGKLKLELLGFDPETATIDQVKLAEFQKRANAWIHDRDSADYPMLGAFYFDMNRDGRLNPQHDFILNPTLVELPGKAPKVPFSISVLEEATRRKLLGDDWPPHFMSLEEAQSFWHLQDGARRMPEAIRYCRRLAVIVHGGAEDHVQVAPDHPHVLAAVEGFLAAGARFVRLNPDRAYVEWIRDGSVESAVDNPAGKHYDHLSIRSALMPETEGGQWEADRALMAAATCELADRVHSGNFAPDLVAVIEQAAPRSPKHIKPTAAKN